VSPRVVRSLLALALSAPLAWVGRAHAEGIVPPWADPHDVPLPSWGRSVAPLRADVPIAAAPGTPDAKRGTIAAGARLPLYGTARAGSCAGRWLLVGPMAWVCSDAAEVSRDAPRAPPPSSEAGGAPAEGLPYRYFFVGADGAEAFLNLPTASDDARAVEAPDEALDPGFSVAIAEEVTARGALWGRTREGKWIPMRALTPYRVSGFHGETLKPEHGMSDRKGDVLDAAWVVSDVANVFSAPAATGKPTARRARFDRLTWHEERAAAHGGGAMVRISDDGVAPEQWVRARDIAHASLSVPPDEIGGTHATERWIDIDIGAQTLVAYEGTRAVFATLVSTGRAPVGDVAATPVGVHRIGAKLATHDMDALEPDLDDSSAGADDADALDDVPYVQYFDQGVALVGAFWHRDLGRPHGRTSVSLAPRDAAWLFAFTAPHLPAGWSSVFPTELDPGSVVRVRAGDAVPRDFPLDKPDGSVIHKSFSPPAESP
jgi:hypothetical protein